MSSPMFDLPEHFPIPVDENGDGPVPYDEVPDRIVCWCGKEDCDV